MESLDPVQEGEESQSWDTQAEDDRPGSHSRAGPRVRTVTNDLIARSLKGKAAAQALNLHMHGQALSSVGESSTWTKAGLTQLQTLYLYDNLLEDLVPLAGLRKTLTALYLQNNRLTSSTSLQGLSNLRKLYLEGNQLSLVSGLASLRQLEEIHLTGQETVAGGLRFERESMVGMAGSLRILCAARCGMQEEALSDLNDLYALRRLDLSHNELTNLDSVEDMLRSKPNLTQLDMAGNPISRQPKYHENVTVMSDSLTTLDGQTITASQRQILLRLQIKRMKSLMAREGASQGQDSGQGQPAGRLPSGGRVAHDSGAVPAQGMRHKAASPPVAGGFGEPRHLARQVSASGRSVQQGSPQGNAEGLGLAMEGRQLSRASSRQ